MSASYIVKMKSGKPKELMGEFLATLTFENSLDIGLGDLSAILVNECLRQLVGILYVAPRFVTHEGTSFS